MPPLRLHIIITITISLIRLHAITITPRCFIITASHITIWYWLIRHYYWLLLSLLPLMVTIIAYWWYYYCYAGYYAIIILSYYCYCCHYAILAIAIGYCCDASLLLRWLLLLSSLHWLILLHITTRYATHTFSITIAGYHIDITLHTLPTCFVTFNIIVFFHCITTTSHTLHYAFRHYTCYYLPLVLSSYCHCHYHLPLFHYATLFFITLLDITLRLLFINIIIIISFIYAIIIIIVATASLRHIAAIDGVITTPLPLLTFVCRIRELRHWLSLLPYITPQPLSLRHWLLLLLHVTPWLLQAIAINSWCCFLLAANIITGFIIIPTAMSHAASFSLLLPVTDYGW